MILKQFRNISAIAISALSVSFSGYTATSSFSVEQPPTFAMPESTDSERGRVTYIWPQPQGVANHGSFTQQLSSDEYWQTVTGAELAKGVKVFAADKALIRLAPKASYHSGARQISESLEMSKMQLSATAQDQVSFKPLADQRDMESAGFRDGSIALTVNNPSDLAFTLKSEQMLSAGASYLLHVKEKHTSHHFNVTAPNILSSQEAALSLEANIGGNGLIPITTKALLISPTGEQLNATYRTGKVSFDQALRHYGARQGLYEVQLTSMANVNGKLVKRSIKVPFVKVARTASISGLKEINQLNIAITEPGRYNVIATLVGEKENGERHQLQTVEVAEWLSSDATIELPFELQKFTDYQQLSLTNVRLTDQSRLMTLQVLPQLD